MRVALSALVFVLFLSPAMYSQRRSDDLLYNRIATLKGRVTLVSRKDGRRFPANGNHFLLQRKDCPRCVIGITTNKDGDYQVSVSEGTYTVIKRYGEREGETTDAIKKGQKRTVTVKGTTVFDFDIEGQD